MENKLLLDANAILRYATDDIHEQHLIVKEAVENRDCYLILPVVQEAVYLLERYYNVSRDTISRFFIELKDAVGIEDEDVYLKAFDHFIETPKLDFVDCVLCSYHEVRKMDLMTFDKKLKGKIEKLS